jgi:hypothetical protein
MKHDESDEEKSEEPRTLRDSSSSTGTISQY